jgi:hypothetical protein
VSAATLRTEPDWDGAALALIEGCARLPAGEPRLRWLEQLALALGDVLYPAFLRVLCLVGRQGDAQAQRAVAAALTEAIEGGRLPAGRQSAWGGASASRREGPVEFLCAWFLRADGAQPLPAPAFDRAARALLGLVGQDETALRLYRARLLAAADDPMEGAWSRRDRQALRALAEHWRSGDAGAADAVDAFLRAARGPALPGWPAAR